MVSCCVAFVGAWSIVDTSVLCLATIFPISWSACSSMGSCPDVRLVDSEVVCDVTSLVVVVVGAVG